MNKILFIASTSPFVVKDGVTAALYSLMKLILEIYDEIDILVVDENRLYKKVNLKLVQDEVEMEFCINYNDYFLVVVSPITSFLKIKDKLPKTRKFILITQISDCIVYELWVSFLLSIKFNKFKLKPLLKLPYYFYQEFMANNISDGILLQTNVDVKIFNSLYRSKKGVSLPNLIINGEGCKPKQKSLNQSIGWCATFSGDYLILAKWFSAKVVVPFLQKNTNIKLSLLGRNNDLFCSYLETKYPNLKGRITSNCYVEDITVFNNSNRVVLCPVFKGYGLINKTIEAMASGTIVLGDITSFNGIEGVSNLSNCLIAESPIEFIKSLETVFNLSDEETLEIGRKACELILNQVMKLDNKTNLEKIIKKNIKSL